MLCTFHLLGSDAQQIMCGIEGYIEGGRQKDKVCGWVETHLDGPGPGVVLSTL